MVTVYISEADRNELERIHYLVEATSNLVERLAKNTMGADGAEELLEKYLEEYAMYFKEYAKTKTKISEKYKPEGEFSSWEADFERSCIYYRE